MIDDQRIGDEGIGSALLVVDLGLANAVTDHLAAAELHLLAVDGEVLLDLDDEVSVGEPHPIAGRGPEHVGIDGTFYLYRHQCAPSADLFPPPLRGRVREGGAACSAARLMATTTPSQFLRTSFLVHRGTRYPRDANQLCGIPPPRPSPATGVGE